MIIYEQAKEEPLVIGKYGTCATYSSFNEYIEKFCFSTLNVCNYLCFCAPNASNASVEGNTQNLNSFNIGFCSHVDIYCCKYLCICRCECGVANQMGNYFGASLCKHTVSTGCGTRIIFVSFCSNPFDSIFINSSQNDFLICMNLQLCTTDNDGFAFSLGGTALCLSGFSGQCYAFCLKKEAGCKYIVYDGVCYNTSLFIYQLGWCTAGSSSRSGYFYPTNIGLISGNVKFLTELCG